MTLENSLNFLHGEKHGIRLKVNQWDYLPGEICTASTGTCYNVGETYPILQQLSILHGIHWLRNQTRQIHTLP